MMWKSIVELENRNGILHFDGCDVRQLAEKYGHRFTFIVKIGFERTIDDWFRPTEPITPIFRFITPSNPTTTPP